MPRHLLLRLAPLLLVLAVPGCGDGPDVNATDPGSSDSAATPSPDTSSPDTSSPDTSTDAPTTPPSGALQKVRVVGEVVQVGDCVVVRDDTPMTWTITGDRAGDLVLGERVQVTGAPDLRALGCGGPVVQAVVVTVLG